MRTDGGGKRSSCDTASRSKHHYGTPEKFCLQSYLLGPDAKTPGWGGVIHGGQTQHKLAADPPNKVHGAPARRALAAPAIWAGQAPEPADSRLFPGCSWPASPAQDLVHAARELVSGSLTRQKPMVVLSLRPHTLSSY